MGNIGEWKNVAPVTQITIHIAEGQIMDIAGIPQNVAIPVIDGDALFNGADLGDLWTVTFNPGKHHESSAICSIGRLEGPTEPSSYTAEKVRST